MIIKTNKSKTTVGFVDCFVYDSCHSRYAGDQIKSVKDLKVDLQGSWMVTHSFLPVLYRGLSS